MDTKTTQRTAARDADGGVTSLVSAVLTRRECSVVRACVAVGIKVANPFADPEIAEQAKRDEAARKWNAKWAAMSPEEKAAYHASLGPFGNECELPGQNEATYERQPPPVFCMEWKFATQAAC